MASTPYFILSPSTLLSLVGLFRGPDKTVLLRPRVFLDT